MVRGRSGHSAYFSTNTYKKVHLLPSSFDEIVKVLGGDPNGTAESVDPKLIV